MGNIILLTIVYVMVQVVPGNNEDYMVDRYTELCPYTPTCLRPAKEEFLANRTKNMPCCFPCSCDDDCLITNTCCPDSQIVRDRIVLTDKQNYLKGNCLITTFNEPGSQYFKSYYTINYCKDSYKLSLLNDLCIREDVNEMIELQRVSDEHGIIYKNEFCAKCNGVTNFTRWQMKLQCDSSFYTDPVVSIDGLIMENCYVLSEPPNATFFENRICYQLTYASCELSNRNDEYYMYVKRACEKDQYGVFMFPPKQFYKNVFCFLCHLLNIGLESKFSNMCPVIIRKRQLGKTPFTSILKMENGVKKEQNSYRESTCADGKIYDKFQEVCRDLKCPLFSHPESGRCEDTFYSVEGIVVRFYIKFSLHKISSENRSAFHQMYFGHSERETFASRINKIFISYNKHCLLCEITLRFLDHFDPSEILITFDVQSSVNCSLLDIKAIYKQFDNWIFKLKVNETYLEFTSETVLEDVQNIDTSSNHWAKIKDCRRGPDIELSEFKCPRIEISGAEYVNIISERGLTKPDIQYDLTTYNDTLLKALSLEICIDEYFSMFSCSGGPYFEMLTISLAFLTVVILRYS